MRFYSLMFFILLLGCGLEESKRPEFNRVLKIDNFEHYVNLFQEQAANFGQNIEISDLIISFKHIPSKNGEVTLGVCWRGGNSTPSIYIDPEHWKTMGMVRRELLMFHEMGHCLLRRDHIEDFVSIMNPYLIQADQFIKNENRLLAELFDDSRYNKMELYDSSYDNRCDHFSSGILSGMGDKVGYP